MLTLPGLIDPHVHLRTPGQTHKEDFTSGSKAAVAGGYTCILDMPNNLEPITNIDRLNKKIKLAKEQAACDIGFHFGSLGDNLEEFKKVDGKVFGLKLYLNKTTGNFIIDKKNLLSIYKAWKINKPILVHAEEDVIDLVIKVCQETKRKTHVCHVSSREELQKIIRAKKNGVKITCGVTPHHLFLTEKDVEKLGSYGKMKPPVYDGFSEYAFKNLKWIDCIESDHAPHTKEEKDSKEFPYGVPNLETTLGLLLTAKSQGLISIKDIKRLCYSGPAKIFGIKPFGGLSASKIIVDENEEWEVKGSKLFTKCKWSPFEGRVLKGKVKKVYIRNKLIYDSGKFLNQSKFLGDDNISRTKKPFFDPLLTYEENYKKGPFGEFTNKKIYENKSEPDHYIFDLPVYLPFGIPAGPLLNSKFVNAALDKGFDIVEYKTVRTEFRASNEWPNVLAVKVDGNLTLAKAIQGLIGSDEYTFPIAITNSFGVPSFDPEIWQKDLNKSVKHARKGQIVIGSFQGTTTGAVEKYIKDFAKAARLVKEAGAKVLEANLSCPNEGSAHLLCFDITRTQEIVEAIKEEIGNTPLIIKIAYFEDQKQLEKLISLVGKTVDGISAINTIPAKIYNQKGEQALPGNNRLVSGVCGHPIKWAGQDMVKRLKTLRDENNLKYQIIGVGGVISSEDYFEYRALGADAVMSATGAMWDPLLAQKIKKLT